VRLGLGRSYRTPNFDELYSEIIFSGHYFVGNEDLKPENSLSVDVSVKRRFTFKALQWQSQLNFNFIDVNDRIEMALIELVPLAKSKYINVSHYQMVNLAWTHQWEWHNWQWNLGASLVGISQEINNGEAVSDDRFLFTQQFNSSISYKVPHWNTVFSTYFKYNGKQQQFVASFDEAGNPTFKPSILSPFSWLDASVRKSFAENRWELTLGARNLLDITSVNQLQPNAGAAHPSPNNLLLGYGRSYFVKLLYNLQF
jgi:outer membrane receptor for ferrienterochelin and colicins